MASEGFESDRGQNEKKILGEILRSLIFDLEKCYIPHLGHSLPSQYFFQLKDDFLLKLLKIEGLHTERHENFLVSKQLVFNEKITFYSNC